MRLVQLKAGEVRRVAVVEEPKLRLLRDFDSMYALAQAAIANGGNLTSVVNGHLTDESLDYDQVYEGRAQWKLLAPIDHPQEIARCLVSGTGLTHLGSARDRASMHMAKEQELTDSMKMFRWGVEGGRPGDGEIGIAPEWFHKGYGSMVHAHGEPLLIPAYAEDGGEEAEIAVAYVIGPDGRPYRVGMAQGNEFSDHRFEKKNYLNLAGSKLRTCSIGPELVIDPDFRAVPGTVTIPARRQGVLVATDLERRRGDVPQPAQPGASPLQVRVAPAPWRRAHSFSRRSFVELWAGDRA